jgi:probable F420-dependent oxidoreductase
MISLPMQLLISDLRSGEQQSTRDCLQAIEEMGYWGVNVVDHILRSDTAVAEHQLEGDSHWRFPDPLSVLPFLAACTNNLRLGIRVLVIPYRTPFAAAHAVATIDSLSGGRMVLGAAPGYDAEEFRMLGVARNERGAMTDEYLEIMCALWEADGPIDYAGRYHTFNGAQLQVGPVQRPRPILWIGGNSRAALRRAIRFGDAWTPSLFPYSWPSPSDGVQLTRAELADCLALAAQERESAGLPALDCVPCSGVPLTFTQKPRHQARQPNEIQQFSAEGTPAELLEEFLLFKATGCSKFVVQFTGKDTASFLSSAEIFATEILAELD